MKFQTISVSNEKKPDHAVRLQRRDSGTFSWIASSALNEALQFVDSVVVRYPFQFVDPDYNPVLHKSMKEQKKGYKFYSFSGTVKTAKGVVVHVRYVPGSFDKKSYLYFSLSLQKVVNGTNATPIPASLDIIRALCNELIPVFSALQIAPLNPLDGVLCRLDISYNFQAGNYKQDYLDYLGRQHYPRRDRSIFANYSVVSGRRDGKNNGIAFVSPAGTIRTSFYDKWKECPHTLRKGTLRMENSYRSAKRIEKLIGKKHPTLADLTAELVKSVLGKDLAVLCLDRPIKSCGHTPYELVVLVGATKAHNLHTYIELERKFPGLSPKEMAEATGYSVKTINQRRKEIHALGINPLSSVNTTLPGLTIDGMSSTPGKNGVERHSNTCNDERPLSIC